MRIRGLVTIGSPAIHRSGRYANDKALGCRHIRALYKDSIPLALLVRSGWDKEATYGLINCPKGYGRLHSFIGNMYLLALGPLEHT